MPTLKRCLLALLVLAVAGRAAAQSFTAGDLVVSTYGDAGTAATANTYADGVVTPITLQEYTTSGSLVFSDTLPTTSSGSNYGIVGEFGSSSEGTIELSGNDEYLTIAGYSASSDTVGAPAGGYSVASGTALAQSTDSNVPRVVATIDASGNVNTSTVLNDVYSTNNPRSVYSPDGTSFYISGQGSGTTDQGLYAGTIGLNTVNTSATPTAIYQTQATRTVEEYNGNLYYSTDVHSKSKGDQTGIFEYTGLPTNSTQGASFVQITPASLGGGTVSNPQVNLSPEGFWFANSTTLYVADTGVPKNATNGTTQIADGGLQKWTLSNGSWTLDYTLRPSNFLSAATSGTASHGETGFEALTGEIVNGNVELFAVSYTAGDADPNGLYELTDSLTSTTGAGDTISELDASGTNENFKGVSFAPIPEPATYGLILGLAALAGGVAVPRLRGLLPSTRSR